MKKEIRSLTLAVMALVSTSTYAGNWVAPAPQFEDFVPNDTFYVYNVGQKGFITNGECWNTQAIVSSSGALKFTFESQEKGGYQAKNNWNNSTWTYMFRCRTDSKAGTEVRTMFVDNNGARAKNIYNISPVGDNRYKISMVDYEDGTNSNDPYNESTEEYPLLLEQYGEGNFCVGVQLDHKSAYAESSESGLNGVTHALYYDIQYTGNEENCQWAFVSSNSYQVWQAKQKLAESMNEAEDNNVSTASAEAVLNNAGATLEEVEAATVKLNMEIAATVTPDNPKDYTSYIQNSNFDDSKYDAWNIRFIAGGDGSKGTNNWHPTNKAEGHIQNVTTATNRATDAVANADGSFSGRFLEAWDGKAYAAHIYQTIKNIPTGVYKAELAAFVNTLDEENATNKTQYVFFNDSRRYISTTNNKNYSSVVFVNADTLSIGLAQDSTIANWTGIDNAKLTYYGSGLVSYQYLSQELKDNIGNTITDESIYRQELMDNFNNAVKAAAATTTVEDAINAYYTTKEAYDALVANVEAYAKLQAFMSELDDAMYNEGLDVQTMYDRVDEMIANAESTTEEILAEIAADKETLDALRKASYKPNDDVTGILVTNPNFNDATDSEPANALSTKGWTVARGSFGGNKEVIEAFNNTYDIYQDIPNVKSGAYKMEVQAFYRTTGDGITGSWTNWQEAGGEDTGNNKVESYLYAGASTAPFSNIFSWEGYSEKPSTGSWSEYESDNGTRYVPNDVTSASYVFTNEPDRYNNSVIGIAVGNKLRIGFKQDNAGLTKHWAIWNNVKLTYLGKDAEAVSPALTALIANANDLAARDMYAKFKEALNTAISSADKAAGSNDGDAMISAYETLATAIENASASANAYATLNSQLDTLKTTLEAKQETAEGTAIATAQALIEEVTAGLSEGSYTNDEAVAKGAEIHAAEKALYKPKGVASDDNPLDYTYMITNPGYTNGTTGWTINKTSGSGNPSVGNEIMEIWNASGEVYQDINGLPAGTYKIQAKGFFRDSTSTWSAHTYYLKETTGVDSIDIHGYMFTRTGENLTNQDSIQMANIVWIDELAKSAGSAEGNWSKYIDSTDVNNQIIYYFPNQRSAARERFEAGEEIYANTLYTTVGEDGKMRLGIFNHRHKANDWLVVTDWKLFYLGTSSSHGTGTGISDINGNDAPIVSTGIYTIDGRKVNTLGKGLNIVRYKDANGKIIVKKVLKK